MNELAREEGGIPGEVEPTEHRARQRLFKRLDRCEAIETSAKMIGLVAKLMLIGGTRQCRR